MAGPYRHKRHHAISYPATCDLLYGLVQYGMHFAHQILPQPHYARNNVIYLHVLQRIILTCSPVVDTVASRARQVQDKMPFPRLVAFGDDVWIQSV